MMVEIEVEVDSKYRAPALGGCKEKELPPVASNFLGLTLLIT